MMDDVRTRRRRRIAAAAAAGAPRPPGGRFRYYQTALGTYRSRLLPK